MNGMSKCRLLAAAGVSIGLLVAAPMAVASDAKPPAATPPSQGNVVRPADTTPTPPKEDAGKGDKAPDERKTPRSCQPEPCCPAVPCASPAGAADVAIAVLFVIAVLGAVAAAGVLLRPSADDRLELAKLRDFVKSQLTREQDQNQAARAWGLQAFELLAHNARLAEPPSVAVLGVQPSGGPAQTLIRIAGRGFLPAVKVLVAGVPATDVTFVSPAELTAKVPTGAAGSRATVTILWPAGQAAYLDAAFTYTA